MQRSSRLPTRSNSSKETIKEMIQSEGGYALPIVLILLLMGSLFVTPLLGFIGQGILTGKHYENKMYEFYSADAGVEDGIHKVENDYASLLVLNDDESYSYTLPETVNGLSTNVTITNVALIRGVVEGYNKSAPHEGWVDLATPVIVEVTADYVEYSVHVSANYTGMGNRRVEEMGVYFTDEPINTQVDDPFDVQFNGTFTLAELEPSSPTYESLTGGFAYVWDWKKNREPTFDFSNPFGSVDFKFRVHDPAWQATAYFAWFTVREMDIGYVASGSLSKWLVEGAAGNTTVSSLVFKIPSGVDVLTYTITP